MSRRKIKIFFLNSPEALSPKSIKNCQDRILLKTQKVFSKRGWHLHTMCADNRWYAENVLLVDWVYMTSNARKKKKIENFRSKNISWCLSLVNLSIHLLANSRILNLYRIMTSEQGWSMYMIVAGPVFANYTAYVGNIATNIVSTVRLPESLWIYFWYFYSKMFSHVAHHQILGYGHLILIPRLFLHFGDRNTVWSPLC